MGEAVIREWHGNSWLTMAMAARSIIETTALAYKTLSQLERAIVESNADRVHKLIMGSFFATRDKENIRLGLGYEATNIVTVVDYLKREIGDIRDCYDKASEIVHPNASGLLLMYSNRDYVNMTINFGRNSMEPGETFGHVAYSALCLEVACDKINILDSFLPDLKNMFVVSA